MKKPNGRRSSEDKLKRGVIPPVAPQPANPELNTIEPTPAADNHTCVVVAVGASAGGLEAFTELLKPLPPNPGMAFVLVPHLDPKHESAMTQLLSRATRMEVWQVHDGMRVKPDCVYVIPPNHTMTIHEGVLRLTQREPGAGPPMPIDMFFRSLAEDCGKSAIGVILSGTASDGTLGVAAIKHEGGITFAQDAGSAKYSSMPNSAIATGHVDFVLPPGDIARELARIRQHPYVNDSSDAHKAEGSAAEHSGEMEQIFRLLRQLRSVDFSDYKPGTIRRRILRRMALSRVESLGDYVRLLRQKPQEVESLHQDILINVTSFFRDAEAFEALKELVYPVLLRGRQPHNTIRLWVPGCSTGEEAYSHAISLVEHVGRARADVSIQIFGTDLSEEAIRTARTGIYKESIAADVSPARLRRFFTRVETGYQIAKSIRDMCVFASQNVFNDPPFSRMDLVSCRNVLIYLSPVLQRRVIPIFHYALKTSGFLMVGNTEGMVGAGAELFDLADKKHKIYRKRMVASPVVFGMPRDYLEDRVPAPADHGVREASAGITPLELQREADRLLLTRYVPAAVVVNEQFDIIQVRGHASRYLELPTGKATLNLLKMAKHGLLLELQSALVEARSSSAPVRRENVRFEAGDGHGTATVEVIPFQAPLQSRLSFVIVFEDVPGVPQVELPPPPSEPADAQDREIGLLKQELVATKEYLQSMIEALEASNEELQSANEETQSGNEELQSTNEELQTSKEELESANEELNTVNDEMQHRNLELTQVNNDLLNLLSSVNIPILMLDADLSIRRMTPQVEKVLGILPTDIGRTIRHIHLKVDIPELERTMLNVMEELQPREMSVQDGQNHSFRLRITPYRTMENHIEGVVLAFLEAARYKGSAEKKTSATKRKSSKRRTTKR